MRVFLCPGSGKIQSFKRWSAESFRKLGLLLQKTGLEVFIILGKEEEEISDIFSGFPILNSLTFSGLSKEIKESDLAICNDSFLMHFLSALNVKTLALYGPTDPGRTKPHQAIIIKTKKELQCMPCWGTSLYGNCPFGIDCLKSIEVTEVFEEVMKIVKIGKNLT
tara:strand:- start:33 stop:527 length:495 start_codon:yes stop_codon:yes gene_type:complete